MIWFYTRDDQRIRLEMHYDNDTAEFVVTIEHPDGHQEIERFPDMSSFSARVFVLEQQFKDQRWNQSGPPVIVPEGFPRQRPTAKVVHGKFSKPRGTTITRRAYATQMRVFDIMLSGTTDLHCSSWTVQCVRETSIGSAAMMVPGMETLVAPTEEEVYARACDLVDRWLLSTRE